MADPLDPFGGLTGDQRDAYAAITNTLSAYGLDSLASTVLGFVQQGYSADTINVLLQNTDAYKQRFSANEQRRQKGLPVLSPAEYLATERSYRQIMANAGLPVGFYDQPSDFTSWLANDVSPVEIQDRVKVATDLVNSVDPATRETFGQWYTTGDIIAYALDQSRSTAILERQAAAAQVGGAASDAGMPIGQGLSEQIAATGIDANSARQGIASASALAKNGAKLSEIYGGTFTAEDAAKQVFLSDVSVQQRQKRLASQERAQFSGQSGTGRTSLSSRSAGQL